METIQLPKLVSTPQTDSWNEWLANAEHILGQLGYRKYVQNHKREDFAFWKSFELDGEKIYQIGILFYDFRKYMDKDPGANRIGVQFECIPINIDCRVDLSVSKDISLSEFEEMAKTFYTSMNKYFK